MFYCLYCIPYQYCWYYHTW